MKEQKVYSLIMKLIAERGGLTFMQLDPPRYTPEQVSELAKVAEEKGLDAFAVGGSIGAQGEILDSIIKAIKENCSLPAILFPGNIATLSRYADAIYFMYMLNSLDPYWITGAQTASAYPIKRMGLEVIPTSYIIVEPGRSVGWVGRAQPVPRNIPYLAGISALAGQYMGSKLIILESGGGAESPAPPEMVSYTKELIEVPLLVAGGIRNERFAYETIKAGADIIQVGSALERAGSMKEASILLERITQAVRKAGREKK